VINGVIDEEWPAALDFREAERESLSRLAFSSVMPHRQYTPRKVPTLAQARRPKFGKANRLR
jgi:hypothetical protein